SPNPAASLAARWCAKEAVIKAMSSVAAAIATSAGKPVPVLFTAGAGAPLIDIEVVSTASGGGASGAPTIVLHGAVKSIADSLAAGGVLSLACSLSHT